MLRVDLGRLAREGSILVEAQVAAGDGLWQDVGVRWEGPVDVRLRAAYAGTGEVVVRGTLRGELKQECRRCLEPVKGGVDQNVTLVFVSTVDGEDADEGDVHTYDPARGTLDLSAAVSEEVFLAANPDVVCDPKCRVLCPRCGANLNEGPCGCTVEEVDPRWEALRALKGK
jgi:uncharacterized protein